MAEPRVPAARPATAGGRRARCPTWLVVAAALLHPASSTSASHITGPPYEPGDSNYWVKLHSLEVSEGELQPPFEEDHSEYELHVRNTYSTALVLTLGLDLRMYDLMATPMILVDGQKIEYSPLNLISVVIQLNETIGPLDKSVTVQLNDPKRGSWLSPTNSMTYRIHLTQPPEYEKVLEAKAIAVTDAAGQEIQSEPPFSSGSSRSSYVFKLKEDQTEVYAQIACSGLSTGMLFDEERIEPGTVKKIDMSHRAEWKSLVHCKYYDRDWTPNEETRTYALTFIRASKLGEKPPVLTMLQDYGVCQPRSAYEAKLGKASRNVSITEGFVCISDRDRPRIMVSYENEASEVYLLSPDKQEVVIMPSYLPVTIKHQHQRQEFTLREHAGNMSRDYPITFIWPAGCGTMVCPQHYLLRRTDGQELAAKRMCLDERCSAKDTAVCCDRLATCDSLTCPLGKQLSTSAKTAECGSAVCRAEDIPHCCENKATCGSYQCPAHKVPRSDAAATYCGNSTCSSKDELRCCEERAPCGTYHCPAGSIPSSAVRYCSSTECEEEDEPHCCRAAAKCSTFACPEGKELREGAGEIECYSSKCAEQDTNTCCRASPGGLAKKGVVEGVNDDGTFRVRFDSGEVDDHVPESALHGGQDHSNLHPGEPIEASVGKDGRTYDHRKYVFGWVHKVHADRTYSVKYESGEVDHHVPSWALRAVDERGHIFVHTAMLTEGERVIASRTHKGYHKEDFAIASIVKVNEDGTYTVRYASGQKDKHVPKWDLRAIDSRGRSHAAGSHKLGDNVEVKLGSKAGLVAHKDQLRTKYLLGHVTGANVDGTYRISYDFGGIEDHVPKWAMRFLDKTLRSSLRSRYSVGDRVEARISMDIANNLTGWGIEALGIATREKVVLYRKVDCWPAATKCGPMPVRGEAVEHPEAPKIPPLPDYDAVANPEGSQLCYFDESCSKSRDDGCNYDIARPMCRFCGFGGFQKCPKPFDCSKGFPGDWPSEHKEWCCSNYNVGCPYECRWGKWWPDEVNGWGPWWTEKKRDWCCENQRIGCPDAEVPEGAARTGAAPAAPTVRVPPESVDSGEAPQPEVVTDSNGEWEAATGADTEWEAPVASHEDARSTARDLELEYATERRRHRAAEGPVPRRPAMRRWATPQFFVAVSSAGMLVLVVGLTLRRRRSQPVSSRGHPTPRGACRPQQRDVALEIFETVWREDVPLIP